VINKFFIFTAVLVLHLSFTTDKCFSQWEQTSGPGGGTVKSFAVSGTNIFAGTGWGGGVFKSTNNGTSWTAVNNGLPLSPFVLSLAVSGTNIFAGTPYYPIGGVYKSTNNGTNWTDVNDGLPNLDIRSLAVSGTNIFAGTDDGGVYKSTNNGTSWTAVNNGLTNLDVYSLAVSGTNIFAGTEVGVFLSTNYGTNWLNKNQGFGVIPSVYSLLIANNYIFAGTYVQSVWRRSLSEIIGIQNISTEIPSAYSLEQNYPNPFNPTTKISFQLPVAGFSSLKIFDITGKEVATLVNEKLNAGTYTVDWNASDFPSGIYFYKLQTEGFTETRRMALIK